MKSEQLVADEIVARRKARGNGRLPEQVLVHLCGSPAVTGQWRRRHAFLVDLEPPHARAVARLEVAGAFVHPDHYGALLVRPLLPEGLDFAARGGGCGQVGGFAAVAHHLRVVDRGGGVVVWPLPLDRFGAGGGGEAFVSGGS